jgi:crotonobetainyl-CoA:carnitine CoA-transferase CaiB-like acyl-CoA transferase
MAGALDGFKVLEVANYISGPFASMLLADLGAEVIKVESPGHGDPFRGWGDVPYSPTFCSLNRNKQSMSLDLRKPEGKEIFLRLARQSDVVIENMRPGVLDRRGLGYEAVRAVNPRIVYCSISGFGSDGPYRDKPGYDTIAQAMGGLLSVLTDMHNPKGTGASLADLVTGMYACYAVQGALIARGRTGMGQKVETSLLQAVIAFGAENSVRYLASGIVPDHNTRVQIAQVYAFLAADDRPFVVHLSSPQKFWHSLADAIDRPDLKEDPRFVDKEMRIKNFNALRAILAEKFATAPREHWLNVLAQRDVPSAPLLNLEEVFADPQVRHLGMLVEMTHPKMGKARLVGSGIFMSETPPQMALPPPIAGEHTGKTLRALGYDETVEVELRSKGVI